MAGITRLVPVFSIALMICSVTAFAAEQAPGSEAPQAETQVYGRDLMTEEERAAHRARMRAAQSEQERQQIRQENHKRMRERARARGLSMPEEPPANGAGKGDCLQRAQGQNRRCSD